MGTRRPGGERLLQELRSDLHGTLNAAIPAGAPVAVLDFPTHANVGDYAIWLGQLHYLRSRGHRIAYLSAHRDYSAARLAERLDDGVILIHGGGNLGDLWPRHQDLRERVLQDFPHRKIVQLPQSIHFDGSARRDSAKRAFSSHPDFTLLVRDSASLDFAEREFDCATALCPDSAFELGRLPRRPPSKRVLCLARTDHESAFGFEGVGGVDVVDWVDDPSRHYSLVRRAVLTASRRTRARSLPSRVTSQLSWRGFEYMAKGQLGLGTDLLSRGSVVVTDRLHGHILCLLLDVPHVLLDNSYGKLSAFYNTWTSSSAITHWAHDPADAVSVAMELTARSNDRAAAA